MDNIAREHIDLNTLRFLYNRYKAFIVPFLVIVFVAGIFIKFTVPSIVDLFKGYEQQRSRKLSLEVMRNNLNFLKSIDVSILNSQFKIATKALPVDKDFDSVLNAISDASNKSGVVLGGFKFLVGSLSKDEVLQSEFPTLSLSVTVKGEVDAVENYLDRLSKALPLSEIAKIASQTDASIITINFYYKPLKVSEANDSLPLGQISDKGLSLINELSSFIPETPDFESSESLVSTPSANPFF